MTKTASPIAQTTATLNASVNPNSGEVSKCEFEYGTTTSYGQTASCASLPGSGSSAVGVSAALTGLTANTTYHFRISATNAGGTSKGSDETLQTPPNSPAIVVCPVLPITQTSATLCGKVNPNGAEVSRCEFEYGTTTAYGSSVPCTPAPGSGSSPVTVSAALAGLSANTTYHFRISATNAGGTSKGSDETFKTLPNAPTVVSEKASSIAQTTATLGASVNPNGGEVSECEFQYGTTVSYGKTAACTPAPGSGSSPVAVSAALTGLTPNTTYHFRISVTNAGGTSKGSDESFETLPSLMITTASLPNGYLGSTYSQTLGASGGVTPYHWSLSIGSLPAGLSLNSETGAITGTPSAAGTQSFTVKVTDSAPRRPRARAPTCRSRSSNPPTRPPSPTMKTPKSSSQNQTPWLSMEAGTSS